MGRLPVLRGRKVIQALENGGFYIVRQRGSHVRMKHPDGRVVTIPVYHGMFLTIQHARVRSLCFA